MTPHPISAMPLWMEHAVIAPPAAQELPGRVDVLIVGAGYTGLSAARETAAAGRSTLVLDGGALGTGCSSRNGGQIAYSIKPSLATLQAKHGADVGFRICREGLDAVAYLRSLAREIDCGWRDDGCFFGAHTARHFERMVRDAENQPRGLEQRISVVSRAEQRGEIASDFYHGGCVYPDDASVDPTRLLLGLLGRARDSGATVVDRCPVNALKATREGFEALTARGVIQARQVLLATNGYSGPLSPWHRRRVIPIGSYQIATEPLGAERVRSLIPRRPNIVDSRRVVASLRPSSTGERSIFGGRAALAARDPLACVPRLRSMLAQILPQLREVALDHAWLGWVAYTFDTMPHLGCRDGIYYCLGYCGQGVPLAPYLGMKIGRQIAQAPDADTALDGLAFPTRPYYSGRPWFLAPAVWANATLDRMGI